MAMYPNATHGYMPFVKPAHKRQAAKKAKIDKADLKQAKSSDMKTYKVTLRDKNGVTYTYIIQADTASKSNPVLCESRVAAPKHLSTSLPNMKSPGLSSPESKRHASCLGLAQAKEDLTKVDDGEKKGLFNSILSFIKKKTSSKSSKSASKQAQAGLKSKRKTKPMFPKKRQRTISAMSNLDPIQESPEEDDDEDSDSYTHDSASDGSISES
ncbi:unnamed protein product [Lymnaea stagnalis]|uniref:Uncharacterized protein n=1 Tax=Lymnaea stagnalis TaxID=6523 RepID=A0AAV2HG91_LYMST